MISSFLPPTHLKTIQKPAPNSPQLSAKDRKTWQHIWDISGKFPGNFRKNSRKIPGKFREISATFPGNFQEFSRKNCKNLKQHYFLLVFCYVLLCFTSPGWEASAQKRGHKNHT